MTFISPEEAVKITRTEDETKRKRGRPTKTTIDPIIGRRMDSVEPLDDVKPEWKKAKKDIREISTVLPMASFVKEKKTINVIGPQITPMMVEFFHKYLEEHSSIKRIAVIGFNSGVYLPTHLIPRIHHRNVPDCARRHRGGRFRPPPNRLRRSLRPFYQ